MLGEMEYQQIMWLITLAFTATGLFPLVYNLGRCYRAILNDARIISRDPALQSNFEILYAYPGFWALFWYRLSHALLHQKIPVISAIVPRLAMSAVRYATSIDIHPAAKISGEGILIDHGTGLVVGATAVIGGEVTLYHGVTLGNSGRKVPAGAKRHPTIGDRVVIGAGAKILGDIVIGDDVLVGANSVVTKAVPRNHTAVGVPARVLCHGAATGKDVAGAAICELHKRLQKVEKDAGETTRRPAVPTATATATATNTATATISTQTTTGTAAVAPATTTAPASTAPASIAAAAPAPAAIATVSGLPSATAVPTTVSGPVSPSVVWAAAAAASPPRGQGSAVPAPRAAFFAEEMLRSGSVPPGFALAKASARGVAAAPAPAAAAVAAAAAATAATAAESTKVKPSSINLTPCSSTTKTNVKPFSTTATNVKPFSTTTTTANVKPFSTTTTNMKPLSTTTKTNVKPVSTTTTTPDVKPFLTAKPSLAAVKPFPTTNAKPSLPVFVASGCGRGVLREKGEGGEGRFGADDDGRSNSIRCTASGFSGRNKTKGWGGGRAVSHGRGGVS